MIALEHLAVEVVEALVVDRPQGQRRAGGLMATVAAP